jgi:CRISPR type I-D-associated protein Csc2
MSISNTFTKLEPYLVEKPRPIIGAETVQLILMREVLDYTILRTEETREINTVHTPLSVNAGQAVRRVAFLATKQKAAESRVLEQLLRTARKNAELEDLECYLKDNLCMQCPRCGLYGGTSTVAGQQDRANIKHRIEYSTAFSLLPFEDIGTSHTFNAINDRNQTTGQALGQRFAVQPATLFPSVITLKSVTKNELILAVKTILACKSYGAESRIGGDIRNTIWGIVAGWEEVITSLELTLELADKLSLLTPESVKQIIVEKYKPMAGNPSKVSVLEVSEVEALVKACADTELDKSFLERSYKDIMEYRNIQLGSGT